METGFLSVDASSNLSDNFPFTFNSKAIFSVFSIIVDIIVSNKAVSGILGSCSRSNVYLTGLFHAGLFLSY